MKRLLCCVLVPVLAAVALAQDETGGAAAKIDKSGFHLFNPTPTRYLRPMTIDGPGATESPYTVDAGHFQAETALVSYSVYHETVDFGAIYRLEWWAIAPVNIKVGVLNRLDLQVLLEPYNIVHEEEGDYYSANYRGYGNTTLRVKYNLWGNDRGRTALALTPYVKLPTSQIALDNKSVEGGLVIPFSLELSRDFYLGLTSRIGAVRNFEAAGYHAEWGNSITLEHNLIGRDLTGYVEFFGLVSAEKHSGWIGVFGTGLTYWLSDNLQLNAGVNVGLTRAADDYNPFVGLAVRF
jgi:outer membrane putative beta-barrel porin/alpha-amylase